MAAAWWAVQQGAATAASSRLHTHCGGPAETYAALERSLIAACAALHPSSSPERKRCMAGRNAAGRDALAGDASARDGSARDTPARGVHVVQQTDQSLGQRGSYGSDATATAAAVTAVEDTSVGAVQQQQQQQQQPKVLMRRPALASSDSGNGPEHRTGPEYRDGSDHTAGPSRAGPGPSLPQRSHATERIREQQPQQPPRESRAALLRRLPLLLEFISALEKALYGCYEGTLSRSSPSSAAVTFFTQNRKVLVSRAVLLMFIGVASWHLQAS